MNRKVIIHSGAAIWTFLSGAFIAVPVFKQEVIDIYNKFPHQLEQAIVCAITLAGYYKALGKKGE